MGAGQIGGIATLLDIDFNNAAGFIGTVAELQEAQYMVYFLSHVMMFCTGALIEAHVIVTPASCVFGERYRFDVYAGSHRFLQGTGASRLVEHMSIHRAYNHSARYETCSSDNIAILVLAEPFSFHKREESTDFIITRLRYGVTSPETFRKLGNCKFYGWGSRRNGFLVPLLLHLQRVDVQILDKENCLQMFNYGDKFLCLQEYSCHSEKHGALCPDDLGAILECSGYFRGLMTSRLIDRPCGVGFLDMSKYAKFITCSVDDSRDILGHNDLMEFQFASRMGPDVEAQVQKVETTTETEIVPDENDFGPPTTPNDQEKETTDSQVSPESEETEEENQEKQK